VLVVDNWPLNRKIDAVHERFGVGAEVPVRVSLSKFFLCQFDSLFFLFGLLPLCLLNDL
jgi:hypothetical protein